MDKYKVKVYKLIMAGVAAETVTLKKDITLPFVPFKGLEIRQANDSFVLSGYVRWSETWERFEADTASVGVSVMNNDEDLMQVYAPMVRSFLLLGWEIDDRCGKIARSDEFMDFLNAERTA